MKRKCLDLRSRLYPEEPSPKNKTVRFFKMMYRKLHLDKSVWNFILLSIIGFSIINVLRNTDFETPEGQDNLLNTAAIVGAAGALLWTANGIHNQYHDNLLSRASHYASAWYGEDLSKDLEIVRNLANEEFDRNHNGLPSILENKNIVPVLALKYGGLTSLQKLSNIQTEIAKKVLSDRHKRESVEKIFSLFEQMGMDVKFGVVDSEYLKDIFYLIVIKYYELFRKYIEYNQNLYDSRFIWCNFVYLAHTWEKEAYAPSIPGICVRKSILTKQECDVLVHAEKEGKNNNHWALSSLTKLH